MISSCWLSETVCESCVVTVYNTSLTVKGIQLFSMLRVGNIQKGWPCSFCLAHITLNFWPTFIIYSTSCHSLNLAKGKHSLFQALFNFLHSLSSGHYYRTEIYVLNISEAIDAIQLLYQSVTEATIIYYSKNRYYVKLNIAICAD